MVAFRLLVANAVTVEAIYAFDAEQQDELSFGKGALVMDVTVKDDDW